MLRHTRLKIQAQKPKKKTYLRCVYTNVSVSCDSEKTLPVLDVVKPLEQVLEMVLL